MNETKAVTVSDGSSMNVYVARPSGAPRAAIMVIQEAFGVNHYIRSIADRFAAEGYLAVAPELFHRSGAGIEIPYDSFDRAPMQALTDEGISADLTAAHAWLSAEGVTHIAAVGFCMGGRAAFLANAILPLFAAVSFYGGGIAQTLLPRTKDLGAPMMLLWGGKDTHILAEHRRAVVDALEEAGKTYVHLVMGEAGHGFFCDERPSYSSKASKQAWPLVLEFLHTNLA